MPSATGIVAQLFGPDRDRALGLFSSVFPIGGIVGPVLGGVFVTYWTWRGIFLVNVPVGILLLVLGAVFIPASRAPRDQRSTSAAWCCSAGRCCRRCSASPTWAAAAPHHAPAFLVPEVVVVGVWSLFVRHSARARRRSSRSGSWPARASAS